MMLAIYRASLRLAWRSVWVWGVTLPVFLLAWAGTTRCQGTACVGEFFHQPFILPFFLGQMIATVAFAQMERAQHADETLEALPYRTGPAVIGRVGALITVWLGAGTLLYLFTAYLAVFRWRMAPDLFLLADWVLVLPLTLLFTTGVAYALGRSLRRGFGAYLIVLLLVLAFSFPFNQITSRLSMWVAGTGPLTATDFTLTSYFAITSLPIFPDIWPLVGNRIFTVGAGVASVSAVIWLSARRRREGGTRIARIACVAGITAVLAASLITRAYWALPMATLQEEEVAVIDMGGTERLAGMPAPAVGGYDLTLRFTPEDEYLNAEAVIEITAADEIATFTLNRTLAVRDVTGPDGAPVPFARHGDLLLLTTSGRPGSYHVVYSGRIWQWRLDPERGMVLAAHITAQSIMLQEGMGWYPVPGRQPLVKYHLGSTGDIGIWHPPVPIRLTILGAEELHFVSNALEGKPVSRAWVIGTPRAPLEEGGMRFYTSPDAQGRVRQFTETYADQIAWYERLVPLSTRPQLVEVPHAAWALRINWETAGFPGAMVVSPTFLRDLDNMVVTGHLLSLWWSNDRTAEEGQVHDVLKYSMAELYHVGILGWERPYISLGRVGAPRGTETEQGQALLEALRQYHQANGLEATGRVLRSLYNSSAPLTYGAVAEAMRP